jgi:hypothetical protein
VTFKDLQKVVESQPDYDNPQHSELERLRDRAFWHWDRGEHKKKDRTYKRDCCFNHIIGLSDYLEKMEKENHYLIMKECCTGHY